MNVFSTQTDEDCEAAWHHVVVMAGWRKGSLLGRHMITVTATWGPADGHYIFPDVINLGFVLFLPQFGFTCASVFDAENYFQGFSGYEPLLKMQYQHVHCLSAASLFSLADVTFTVFSMSGYSPRNQAHFLWLGKFPRVGLPLYPWPLIKVAFLLDNGWWCWRKYQNIPWHSAQFPNTLYRGSAQHLTSPCVNGIMKCQETNHICWKNKPLWRGYDCKWNNHLKSSKYLNLSSIFKA